MNCNFPPTGKDLLPVVENKLAVPSVGMRQDIDHRQSSTYDSEKKKLRGKILPYDEHIRYILVSLSHLRWQHLRYVYIGAAGLSLSLGLLAQIRHVGMEPLNKDLECSMKQSGWETHIAFQRKAQLISFPLQVRGLYLLGEKYN